MNTNKESQEQKEVEKKLNLEIREMDLITSYKYFRNYIAETPILEYIVKKKCVEIGKELLPTDDGVEEIYKEACKVLNEERPGRRTIKYEFQDFGEDRVIPIYKILAGDADEAQSKEEEFEKVLKNFSMQQYENHIGRLQDLDNKIFHVLVQKGIIEKKIPTLDNILNKRIEKVYNNME